MRAARAKAAQAFGCCCPIRLPRRSPDRSGYGSKRIGLCSQGVGLAGTTGDQARREPTGTACRIACESDLRCWLACPAVFWKRSDTTASTRFPAPKRSAPENRRPATAESTSCALFRNVLAAEQIAFAPARQDRSEEHTSELQSLRHLVCRLLLEKKNHVAKTRKPRVATPDHAIRQHGDTRPGHLVHLPPAIQRLRHLHEPAGAFLQNRDSRRTD